MSNLFITQLVLRLYFNNKLLFMAGQDEASRPGSTMDHSSMSSPYFDSSYTGTSIFVGSPDSLSYQIPSRPPRSDLVTTPRSRPVPGSRSISPPSIPRRGTSTDQRISSGVMGLQQGTPKLEQWTLFGQLMENEGQLPSPLSMHASTSRKRPTTPRREEPEERVASGSGSTAARKNNGDPFLEVSVFEETEPADRTARLPRHYSPSAEDDNNYDSGSDSDTNDGPPSPISPDASERKASESLINRIPHIPVLYRNVLKCSIAYFIASLFTFSPHLSSFISDLTSHGPGPHTPFPSGHMVATM